MKGSTEVHMKAYLIFSDGEVIEGEGFGHTSDAIGELTFNTSMGGAREVLGDPANFGQIVTLTYPLLDAVGADNYENVAVRSGAAGYVSHEAYSENSMAGSLDGFLKHSRIAGIGGVDTRKITRKLRDAGQTLNGMIVFGELDDAKKQAALTKIAAYKISGAVGAVTSKKVTEFKAAGAVKNVALLDLGYKPCIVDSLLERGCSVTVFPAGTKAQALTGFDGVVLSGGPFTTADYVAGSGENTDIIENIRQIAAEKPILALDTGHLLLALSQGCSVYQLPVGHRGANHPVKDLVSGRVYSVSLNHGYAVDKDSVKSGKISLLSVNDGTVMGIDFEQINAISMQCYPEAAPGPDDMAFMYDRFIELLK